MPTAINVKEDKEANNTIVRFETSTSPNWKDIKIFISNFFLNINIIEKLLFVNSYKFKRITIPNTIRQIINTFKPFEEKYFNKKSIANNEDKKVETRLKIRGKKFKVDNSLME